MANRRHLEILKKGVKVWNTWREENPRITPDLSNVDFNDPVFFRSNYQEDGDYGAELGGVNFSGTYLHDATFYAANLSKANLEDADLCGSDFRYAELIKTDLTAASLVGVDFSSATLKWAKIDGANLEGANFFDANLFGASLVNSKLKDVYFNGARLGDVDFMMADLTGAKFGGASIAGAKLVRANLTNATLVNCSVYGVSIWDAELSGTIQKNLYINAPDQPKITVDNIEVAQFIHLLLNNKKIRDVIDTITSKVVLILGRFTLERKAVLDALRDELRQQNYTPVLFDFDKPANRDVTETVSILAHISRFVIADITDAKSIPQELQAIIPHLPSVPIQPLLHASDREYSMFEHFPRYPWVLTPYYYTDQASLRQTLKQHVIDPAEKKVKELAQQ